jgi:hypothetical protein
MMRANDKYEWRLCCIDEVRVQTFTDMAGLYDVVFERLLPSLLGQGRAGVYMYSMHKC